MIDAATAGILIDGDFERAKSSPDPQSSYYDVGGIVTLDVIKAKLTAEQWQGYLLGNLIKYACRLNHKGHAYRDAIKAANYAKWLAEALAKV